jgi:hypothetical protein
MMTGKERASDAPTRGIAVFLGPSVSRAQAAGVLDATFHPPVAQGDIVRIVSRDNPHTLVLIDGVFAKAPAVRHKEILWAMARGCAVFGAASMGALRAAELAPYGMVGHGLIYRWYRATPYADDDDVAVAMTPAEIGASALSEALINMRLTMKLAERCGIIGRDLRLATVAAARSLHFIERTYERVLADVRRIQPARSLPQLAALEAWLPANAIDQKRTDALALLRGLADGAFPPRSSDRHTAPFIVTEAFVNDLAASGIPADRLRM